VNTEHAIPPGELHICAQAQECVAVDQTLPRFRQAKKAPWPNPTFDRPNQEELACFRREPRRPPAPSRP
jgi:fructose-1-phosphate kinase PfkB-like protein